MLVYEAGLMAFGISLILTPVMAWVARKIGFLAYPHSRGVHQKPIPYLGGVAMAAAFFLALYLAGGIGGKAMGVVALGGLGMLLLGLWDDARPLRPLWKFLGQVAIAAGAVAGGLRVEVITHPLGEGYLNLGILSWPFSILWIVALVNVLNLSDGLDGLASGITAISSLTLLLAAAFTGAPAAILLMAAALLGASAGFLPWNFHPARIFMGDAGSLFLGYMLAAISIQGALKAPAALSILVPILVLGVPIFDTAWAILRRWRAGQPIGQADNGHLHHRLLGFGLSQRQTVLLLYCISAWLGLGSLALVYLPHVLALLILALVAFSIYVVVSLVRNPGAVASEEVGTWES